MKNFYFFLSIVLILLFACGKQEVKEEDNTVSIINTVTASSFIIEDFETYLKYHPLNVVDGDPLTVWNEGVDGSGIHEKVTVGFTSMIDIDRIDILTGYFDPQWYGQKNRIKTLRINFYEVEHRLMFGKVDKLTTTIDVGLIDTMKSQTISLSQTQKCISVDFEILDIYKGDIYDDTSISEIRFYYRTKEISVDQKKVRNNMIKLLKNPSMSSPKGKAITIDTLIVPLTHYFFRDNTYVRAQWPFISDPFYETNFPVACYIGKWE